MSSARIGNLLAPIEQANATACTNFLSSIRALGWSVHEIFGKAINNPNDKGLLALWNGEDRETFASRVTATSDQLLSSRDLTESQKPEFKIAIDNIHQRISQINTLLAPPFKLDNQWGLEGFEAVEYQMTNNVTEFQKINSQITRVIQGGITSLAGTFEKLRSEVHEKDNKELLRKVKLFEMKSNSLEREIKKDTVRIKFFTMNQQNAFIKCFDIFREQRESFLQLYELKYDYSLVSDVNIQSINLNLGQYDEQIAQLLAQQSDVASKLSRVSGADGPKKPESVPKIPSDEKKNPISDFRRSFSFSFMKEKKPEASPPVEKEKSPVAKAESARKEDPKSKERAASVIAEPPKKKKEEGRPASMSADEDVGNLRKSGFFRGFLSGPKSKNGEDKTGATP